MQVRYIAQKFANAILADTSSYIISTDGLQALNAFLDELLFILVDTAKGLETTRIKSAVYQIFPTALGKNAIVEAELEAKSYIDMGGKDTSNHLGNSGQSATSSLFNADSDETRVEQVFEQFRTKCQYYSKLGERLGSPAGNPNNAIAVPTLIAIYVTAVLEHIAEYVLQIASTIADRQDHADMVTVREIYVALLEDRQIEHTFEIMILKSQLQKRFRHSLIMPGTGPRPEELQPATVKRSGSWGKQLRLGNADKPKLDVQLPTDVEEDDTPIDPNRPQFGDWDEPPDEENKAKKKSDFEMLFSSGETMKVSLTPNRLRTIEVHRKAGGAGGAMARSHSRAASVIGGKDGKSHGRRPSHGATAAAAAAAAANANGPPAIGARKSSQAPTAVDTHAQPPLPATPNVPAIPANFGVSQPILKKQGQHGATPDAPPLTPMQNVQLRQQQSAKGQQAPEHHGLGIANKSSGTQMENGRASTSTFESQLTLSTAGASSVAALSPVTSRSPVSPTGSIKSPAQATNDLVNLIGGNSSQSMFPEHGEPPMSPTFEAGQAKKENPIKSFMGRLGRNSLQRTSMDSNISNPAPSPTSIRSFNTGAPGSGSTSGSTNGSVSSGHSGQTSVTTAPYQGLGQNVYDQPPLSPSRPSPTDQRQNMGFPLPPDSSSANKKPSSGAYNKPPPSIPTPLNVVAAHANNFAASPTAMHHQHQQKPMSPDLNGFPIPSRNASLNHDLTSPTKTTFTNSYDARTGLEAGLPRPLSPRPLSPRPASPRPSSPSQSPQNHHPHPLRNNSFESNGQGAGPGGILAPSPLSNSISGSNVSPSGSSTSLIMYGKVSNIQDQLTKIAQPPAHGFKPQEHLQKHPNRISLEGTIRANPFYQQDRSSVRSSLADLSSTAGSSPNSAEIPAQGNNYKSGSTPGTPPALPTSAFLKVAATPTPGTSAAVGSNSDSDSTDMRDDDEKRGMSIRDGMVSPAASPELGTLKDRLPSATTRTLAATSASAAALFAGKHQHQQHQTATPPASESNQQFKSTEAADQDDDASLSSPTKRRGSVGSQNATTNRQFHVYADNNAAGEETLSPEEEEEDEEEEEEEEEETPYVAVVPRSVPGGANRHSIFVDEAAQAMDALSRARHRQSMRLEGEEVDDDDDEEDDDEDYPHGITPPEKWHYSDLEDEEEYEEEEEDENDDDSVTGERRRRHESFMSAKSTFMPNGSSVSLVSAYAGQDDDDDDSSIEGGNSSSRRRLHKDTQEEVEGDQIREREIQSLEVQSSPEKQQQQDMSSPHQDLTPSDFVKGDEYTADRLIPVGGSDDEEDRNGEDEDESEDSEDLEDNDDEEGQDRRIYLQQLRHQAREARRQERLANGGVDSKNKKKNNSNNYSNDTTTTTTSNAGGRFIKKVPSLDSTGGSGLKKKTLRKGHSKENLRDQDRPQTPTTPVPTTQIIPLTPTDFVLIRQKLFAAGNFEASMRMLDTIFHAAMAKMVEGRERGMQTEPMTVSDVQAQVQEKADVAAVTGVVAVDEAKKGETPIVKGVSVSTSTSTETDDLQQGDKKKTWVDAAVETPAVAPVEDDDDEDRVVEWLLAGW
ncbi:hypothetical protein KI688_005089 [Linnemannia hyalina]|uniref:Uncharacterized protein n=1 Tax=Linnemannia hyalina TaxID=64524 RepID=A0A9P8BP58_9FUNG|nr:hypothetical protein KI688_005089 [Linnemannia hyalina]